MIAVTGGLTVLLGILAFIGWMTDVYVLAGLSPDYIPMAPATAILSIGYGLLLLSGFYRISHRTSRSPVLVVIGIFTLYAFLKFIEYFGNMELTFDPFLFPVKKKFLDFPVYRTSPITGLLFFLCGVAVLIKILGREKKFLMNLVGGLGIVILFAGFTGLIGYIFETPFLYKGNLIPLALLTTIVFLLLGIGLVAMGGERSLFLNQFLGMHPGARMLRIMVPVIIIALLADDLLARFSDIPILNHALISSVVTLVLVFVTVIVIVQVSKIIFRKADKAESENRRIREELQNQNDFLMTVIESLPYPFYVINPKDYSITLGNSASGWKTGIDNKNGYQLSHDVKIPCGNKNYPYPTDIIRKTKKPVVLEHLHRDKEGNQRYVEVHAFPILDRKGNLIQVIEYSIDITERKKLEEELKESEKRYRILVNTLGEGVALADPDERFVFANPEAERIFGVPPAGLTGRNLKEFLPPDQISKVLFETGKRTNEEQSTYEIDIITPGNQLRHLLLTATPLLGEEGKYIAALGIFRNITEQKQMEAEIATFTRELQESNATKDKFFSIIAHDLKNPFNAILGLTDLITEELHTLNKETIQNIIHTIKT